MPSLYLITNAALAASADINQLVNTLAGNQNTPVSVRNTDPIAYTLQLENTDTAGKALLIYGPDSTTVLARVQANGVVASPDGTAAAPIVTTTHAQTLMNKTFTAPTINGPTGDVLARLATVGPLGGVQATMAFSAIPQTFHHLELIVYGRSDTATTVTPLKIQLNSDTAAHYYDQRRVGVGATSSADEVLGATSGRVGLLTAASDAATLYATARILIPNYTVSTSEKTINAQASCASALTTGTINDLSLTCQWDSTAAITTITLLPGAGSFAAGSRADLYGWP